MALEDLDAGDIITIPAESGKWRLYLVTMRQVSGAITLTRLDAPLEFDNQLAAAMAIAAKREVTYMRRQGTGGTLTDE